MSIPADRALYGLTYWQRAGDQARMRELADVLDPDVRAEAAGLLHDVGETLHELPEDELRARMLALAGKSKETRVSEPQREITTILGGSRGAPPIMIRDHGAWEAQVAAENRAKADAEIKAAVAVIERGEQERKFAPRPSVTELANGARRIAARELDRRVESTRVELELAALEHTITAQLAAVAEPPPQPERHGRPLSTAAVAYEAQQLAWQSKQARQAMAAGCGTCLACRTGGVYPCVRW